MYINIDFELLNAELHFVGHKASWKNNWKRYSPTTKVIDALFREYEVLEFMENFYDSEPNYDEEEFNMYMDYIAKHETEDEVTGKGLFNALLYMGDEKQQKLKRFSKEKHTAKEIKTAYEKIKRLQEDYNEKRIAFNNWQEPHFKGNWGTTQKQVTTMAKKVLKEVINATVDNRDRLWVLYIPKAEIPKGSKSWNGQIKNDLCYIVYYGRDYREVDYVWVLEKKKEM